MLIILFASSLDRLLNNRPQTGSTEKANASNLDADLKNRVMLRLAIPQLLLALTALTTSHVQIITRLASGSPLWYIWIADQISSGTKDQAREAKSWTGVVVRWMVIYAMVQGGLFASFLPPA